MIDVSRNHPSDRDEKKVIFLEFVAASSIFLIIALVLYLVLTYQPA